MPFDLPDGLAPEVYPLAWLVGHWRGEGVVGYPGIEEAAFVQDVQVDHDGGPYLRYTSTMRLVVVPDNPAALIDEIDRDVAVENGAPGGEPAGAALPKESGPVWSTESGFWRVSPERPDELGEGEFPVELLLADPAGHLALYLGMVGSGRIELASDLIASTATAVDVSAGTRLYGLVQGDLMWAWDLAAFGQPLQTYASARLIRMEV